MRSIFLLLVVMLAMPLAGCIDDTPVYRYRLKVEIDTPSGLRTGSSVIEVETAISSGLPTPGVVQTRYRGEAVEIDLGEAGTVFALLVSKQRADWAGSLMYLLAPAVAYSGEDQFERRFGKMLNMQREVTLPQNYSASKYQRASTGVPMFVTFEDLSDPNSVREVNPEDLSATFGDGYSLRRITVQMTDAPVTVGIVDRLGWLPELYPGMLNGDRFQNFEQDGLASQISVGAFSTELRS